MCKKQQNYPTKSLNGKVPNKRHVNTFKIKSCQKRHTLPSPISCLRSFSSLCVFFVKIIQHETEKTPIPSIYDRSCHFIGWRNRRNPACVWLAGVALLESIGRLWEFSEKALATMRFVACTSNVLPSLVFCACFGYRGTWPHVWILSVAFSMDVLDDFPLSDLSWRGSAEQRCRRCWPLVLSGPRRKRIGGMLWKSLRSWSCTDTWVSGAKGVISTTNSRFISPPPSFLSLPTPTLLDVYRIVALDWLLCLLLMFYQYRSPLIILFWSIPC